MPSTMLSAHVYAEGNSVVVKVRRIDKPSPAAGQVLIQVVCSGTNPKDWKLPIVYPEYQGLNTGDDIAGVVAAVGGGVTEFKIGDRVAAMHEMFTPYGSFAEYAIAWERTTFHLPDHTSFEDGATIPLAAMTAAVGLHRCLGLPEAASPGRRLATAGGVVVYGAASAVGAFAIKLLRRAGIHPIIAVAGHSIHFVKGLLDPSAGDAVIDYLEGDDVVVERIRAAIPPGQKLLYAFDAVSEKGSYQNIIKVLDPSGHISLVLPYLKYPEIPDTVHQTVTTVGSVHGSPEDLKPFGYKWFRRFSRGLEEEWLSPHRHEVIPGGLNGVQKGLENLMAGKANAVKYVYRIGETEGIERIASVEQIAR